MGKKIKRDAFKPSRGKVQPAKGRPGDAIALLRAYNDSGGRFDVLNDTADTVNERRQRGGDRPAGHQKANR